MKKRFSHKRSAFLTPRIFSGGSIVLAVAVLFALFRFVTPGAFLTITTPLFSASSYVYENVSRASVLLSDKQKLYDENQNLIMQNEALINRNRALSVQVNTLIALAGTTTPRVRGVVARVLARPNQSPYDTLIIGAGTASGSATGDVITAMGGIRFWFSSVLLSDKQKLYDENQNLIMQNEALINRNRALSVQVNTLIALAGTTTPRVRGVVARVLARPNQSPYDTLIIGAGTASGSATGDVITAMGGIPIGTIKEVSTFSSRVLLFSSPGITTDAWVGVARNPITLKGTGAGTFTASVPHQTDIAVGDLVFVSGAPYFAIGRVVRVDAITGIVMETLRIKPFVNIFSLPTVVVMHRTMP